MKLFLFLLTATTVLLHSQPIQIGVKGGAILTDSLRTGVDESKPFTVGPTVEFQLPRSFALETGFLYKRTGTSAEFRGTDFRSQFRTRGNSFEVPVIGKYYLPKTKTVTPFLGLGVALRRSWQTTDSTTTGPNLLPTGSFRLEDASSFGAAAVGSAGFRVNAGRIKIAPEFRYSRWGGEAQRLPRNPNQVEFLIGVSY